MKKCCVWLLALCVSQGVAAQDPEAGECVFHTGLEQYPTFMGGDLTEFRAWVYRNVRYPREAFDRGEQGRILVSFVIDTLGNVTQVGPLSAAAVVMRSAARSPRGRMNGTRSCCRSGRRGR